MSSTIRRLVQVALVAAMLAGCTTTGTIDRRVAVPDKPAAAVDTIDPYFSDPVSGDWGPVGGP